jgi:hypothetical protein
MTFEKLSLLFLKNQLVYFKVIKEINNVNYLLTWNNL